MSGLSVATVSRRKRASVAVARKASRTQEATVRTALGTDVDAIERLVSDHVIQGRLLPRSREEIAAHVPRFLVAVDDGGVVACADLAPLSRRVAEVRSLVVADGARACGLGRRLVEELELRALAAGFETLCAFTHAPGYFVQLGFSIVPHVWLPEKIEADCRSCSQFRQCGQYAVMLPLVRPRASHASAHVTHA